MYELACDPRPDPPQTRCGGRRPRPRQTFDCLCLYKHFISRMRCKDGRCTDHTKNRRILYPECIKDALFLEVVRRGRREVCRGVLTVLSRESIASSAQIQVPPLALVFFSISSCNGGPWEPRSSSRQKKRTHLRFPAAVGQALRSNHYTIVSIQLSFSVGRIRRTLRQRRHSTKRDKTSVLIIEVCTERHAQPPMPQVMWMSK